MLSPTVINELVFFTYSYLFYILSQGNIIQTYLDNPILYVWSANFIVTMFKLSLCVQFNGDNTT